MGKEIECIYENNVLKPVGRMPLKDCERIRVTIEKNLTFGPVRLKRKPSQDQVRAVRDEAWTY